VTVKDRQRVEHFQETREQGRPSVGNSAQMKQIRKQVQQFCDLEEPVLIVGPTGSGKERVARSLHQAGSRGKDNEGPFVVINCGAISRDDNTALDHLFGHVAGAFTGAGRARSGAFQRAHRGTLFLDEVGDLPMQAQVQLLRAIETRRIAPQGADDEVGVDVRLVCATNRNLPGLVRKGKFREDLLFRLLVLVIETPALRDRREDIKPILDACDWEWAQERRGGQKTLTQADWDTITTYDWPGNVRQLRNVYRRARVLGISMRESVERECEYLTRAFTGDEGAEELMLPSSEADVQPFEQVQRLYFQRVWELVSKRTGRAAELLGVSANTVRKYVQDKS
jgi:two-component system response regulator HydG